MGYEEILDEIKGKKCWKAVRTHGTMFLLHFGNKIWDEIGKRDTGEYAILVQSDGWSILKDKKIVVETNESDFKILSQGLKNLEGEKIVDVLLNKEVVISFSNNLSLLVPNEIVFYSPAYSASFNKGKFVG